MDKSSFFHDVFEVAKLIPRGRVTSYGAIGSYLGLTRAARMVGWAMNSAIKDPDVPAHRVVNRNGVLTGKNHFATPTHMQEMLESEGVKVKNDTIQDFEKIFWSPSTDLGF